MKYQIHNGGYELYLIFLLPAFNFIVHCMVVCKLVYGLLQALQRAAGKLQPQRSYNVSSLLSGILDGRNCSGNVQY